MGGFAYSPDVMFATLVNECSRSLFCPSLAPLPQLFPLIRRLKKEACAIAEGAHREQLELVCWCHVMSRL